MLLLESLQVHGNLGLFEVVVGEARLEPDGTCVDLGVFGKWACGHGSAVLVQDVKRLVEVLEGKLVHALIADVENEVDLPFFTDTPNEGFENLFALQVFWMNVDAALPLDDIDNLKLAKDVMQVLLELFGLPVTELFISISVVEGDCLITLVNMRAICLLLVALHDADNSLVPGCVPRRDQVFPLILVVRYFAEESVFGD